MPLTSRISYQNTQLLSCTPVLVHANAAHSISSDVMSPDWRFVIWKNIIIAVKCSTPHFLWSYPDVGKGVVDIVPQN